MSKGDTLRPLSVSREQYESAWDRTFGRKGAYLGGVSFPIRLEASHPRNAITLESGVDSVTVRYVSEE